MRVEDLLLHKGGRIVSVRMDESVETAARMLRRENIGAVVVKDVCGTEGDTVVGMLSERDILRAVIDFGPTVLKKPVSSLMSKSVISCGPKDELAHAIGLLDRHQIRHLPVLDNHTLIGVISIRDVVAVAAAAASKTDPGTHRSAA